MTPSLKANLRAEALRLGFHACAIARPDAIPHAPARLAEFVIQGRHGQMNWMAERMEWRANPSALWPDVRSIVMLAESYSPEHDPLELLAHRDRGVISAYALGRDYHDVVKKRLKHLARWLIAAGGGEVKVFVDTAPVMEKPLAAAAGVGWQGKHTNLLSRDLGNWFFLGAVFTTLDLPADTPAQDNCGSCRACLDICPTNAFPAPYQLDAQRCISYLTIEHHGPVPHDLRAQMGNRIYGCDDCLAICPWNKFAQTASEAKYAARDGMVLPALEELAALDDAEFRTRFSGSPIKRIGRNRFVRNVLYAIGNSEAAQLVQTAQALCADPDPTVAEAAQWAVVRLKATATSDTGAATRPRS